jgi:hypothetical protein
LKEGASRWPAPKRAGSIVTLTAASLVALVACGSGMDTHRPGDQSAGSTPTAGTAPASARRELRITEPVKAHGWVVLPTSTGPFVAAGAGKLYAIRDREARLVASADYWDYDYVQLAHGRDGTVLVASGRTLWEFDPGIGSFAHRYDLGRLGYLDAVLSTDAGTWVTASGGKQNVLAKIDLGSGQVLDRIPIGQGLHQLIESAGYLLVRSRNTDPAIARVDPGTGELTRVPAPEGSMGVIGSQVWVASGSEITCTDVIRLTRCGGAAINGAVLLASDGDLLWVLSSPYPGRPAAVTMLDGTSGQVLAGPVLLDDHSPATISALDGHAWIGLSRHGHDRPHRPMRAGKMCGMTRAWGGQDSNPRHEG